MDTNRHSLSSAMSNAFKAFYLQNRKLLGPVCHLHTANTLNLRFIVSLHVTVQLSPHLAFWLRLCIATSCLGTRVTHNTCMAYTPGLNWILTPASFWIFLIISPFLPITIPTANRGTETWGGGRDKESYEKGSTTRSKLGKCSGRALWCMF